MKLPRSMSQWVTDFGLLRKIQLALFVGIAAGLATPAVGQLCEPLRACEPFQADGDPYWHKELDEGSGDEGRIAVVVRDDLYNSVSSAIMTYANDLQTEGHVVVVYTFDGPADEPEVGLRQRLQSLYPDDGSGLLTGAVLIGNLPHICYELGSGQWPEDAFLAPLRKAHRSGGCS